MTCSTPDSGEWIFGGSASITVTLNGVDYSASGGEEFVFYDPVEILTISPKYGSVGLEGGMLTVNGRNFVDSTGLVCKFGVEIVVGVYVRETVVNCPIPVLTAEEVFSSEEENEHVVSVSVSNNGGSDFAMRELEYVYRREASVGGGVSPASGPRGGGTVVKVLGERFERNDVITCKVSFKVANNPNKHHTTYTHIHTHTTILTAIFNTHSSANKHNQYQQHSYR